MAQTIINNGDTGLVSRNAINDNFTELYTYSLRTNVASQINTDLSAKATPIGADYLMIEDSTDSWNKKKVLLSNMIATDGTAIHDNVNGEINAITSKATPTTSDVLIIEDAAAGFAKKKITLGTLPFDSTKIQDTAGTTSLDVEDGTYANQIIGHSANTGTALIMQIFEGTGTPVPVFQIDGNGTLQTNGKDLLYFQSNNIVCNPTEDVSGSIAGSQNVGIGHFAFGTSMSGNRDVGIGYNALGSLTNGSDIVAIGYNTLAAMTTGDYCIGMGTNAGLAITTEQYNILIGNDAGRYITQGDTLIIDPYNRTNAAGDQTKSMIYGRFNATKASQTITFNAATTISNDLTGDIFTIDDGTSEVLAVDNNGNLENTGYHKSTGMIRAIDVITGGTTNLTDDHYTLICNAVSSSITMNLPTISATNNGTIYVIQGYDATNTITLAAGGSDYIGYTGTDTSVTFAAGEKATYQANNALGRWIEISGRKL
jgi:hypothetical protein